MARSSRCRPLAFRSSPRRAYPAPPRNSSFSICHTPTSLPPTPPRSAARKAAPCPRGGGAAVFRGPSATLPWPPPSLGTNLLKVGQPVKLSVYVRDSSGLSRIAPPPPPASADWQIFAGSGDAASGIPPGRGIALFTYTLVPLVASLRETPAIPFSYFDPVRRLYQHLTIPPMAVTVNSGLGPG